MPGTDHRSPVRRGPRGGYAFIEKDRYRAAIWAAFRDECQPFLAHAQAVLLPSSEGTEIEVALAHGFREGNLHVVDWNLKVVLALKERFPAIQIYGCSLAEAMHQMAMDRTQIHVANFDLCGPVGNELLPTLQYSAASGVIAPGGLIAITILRGREHEWAIQRVRDLQRDEGAFRRRLRKRGLELPLYASADCWRLTELRLALSTFCIGAEPVLDTHSHQPRSGIYSSGPQSMLWAIYRLRLHEPTVTGAFAELYARVNHSKEPR